MTTLPMRIALLCLLLLVAQASTALEPACRGSVFHDRNGNGIREARERGIAGVRVSDGESIQASDAAGRFTLQPSIDQGLFLIKPAGYDAARRADGLPATWVRGPGARCHDFALTPAGGRSSRGDLEVLVFGDPQPKTLVDVGHYEKDIVAPLRGRHRARLALSLGDIVHDDLTLYPALKAVDASLAVPWLHAPGNHDVEFDATTDERSLHGFRQAFGPDSYAWEESEANFIVLDDVVFLPGKPSGYVGGLREAQFRFLSAYLAQVPKDRLLVVSLHIPLFNTTVGGESFRPADRERLFSLLLPFPRVLLLSAHSHKQQHFMHGNASGWRGAAPLHEYNVGAACGAYWSGAPDAAGIPAATMNDGTPNGYALLRVSSQGHALRWNVARASGDLQIGLHAPKVLRRGAYPAFGAYANVFMGREDTVVEYRIDDGAWSPMKRVLQADPALLAENMKDDLASGLRGFDRSPEAVPSTHLWRGVLPTDLPTGSHRIEVRAQVAGFGLATAQASYRLDEASGNDLGK